LPDGSAVKVALEDPLNVNTVPLPMDDGLTDPEMLQVGTVILSRNDGAAPPALAVRVAVWAAVTTAAEAMKVALKAPAGTMTAAGTVTLALLLERATLVPPAGAALVKVTVQVDVPGPLIVTGEQLTEPDLTVTVNAIELDIVIPFIEAFTVTLWAEPSVPVVAAKVAPFWFAATVTLAGTNNATLLLRNVTTLAVRAALFKATVHVVDELLPKLEGEHDRDDICAGAVPVRVNVWVVPLNEAVSSAVWFELKVATAAVNEALLCPVPTVTVDGTVKLALLLDKETLAPPASAAPLNVTLHAAVPGAVTFEGVQERPVNLGATGCVIPIAPLVADEGMTLPFRSVTTTPVAWIAARVSVVPELMPKLAVATTPSATMLLFTPTTTQIVLPLLLAHVTVLPAAVALGPATTLTVAISDTG
jgi:hypothetical protein